MAGGRGRRTGGRDKGLIEFNGRALIEYSLEALKPWCQEIYINCNRNKSLYARYGFPLIGDLTQNYPGPLAALGGLLPQLRGHFFIILPCDTPGIDRQLVGRLVEANRQAPDCWIYAVSGGRDHPLHAVIPAQLVPEIEQQVASGETRLMKALERLPSKQVHFADGLQLNLNTPDDNKHNQANASGKDESLK